MTPGDCRRFAVYYAPPAGSALAAFGAAWLGWDPDKGAPVPHADVPGLPAPLADMTRAPRKYGFHGTLKPPFRLAPGQSAATLLDAFDRLVPALPTATVDGLVAATLGRFVALVPEGDTEALATLAAKTVRAFEPFRAPPTEAELTRRRAAGLTARQEELLLHWGYPYVMEEFRFHMTLTGSLQPEDASAVVSAARALTRPLRLEPFTFKELALFGEDEDGRFHILRRAPLGG